MDRREFLKKAGAAGAGALLLRGVRAAEPDTASAGVVGHCRWGAIAGQRGTETWQTALTNLEAKIGRKFAVYRKYHVWEEPLPTKFELWNVANGRTPYVAWHAWYADGTPVSWAQIALGTFDPWIRTQADSIKAWGQPMYFAFHHEPENDPACGTAADFRAAYDHIKKIFDKRGVTNLTWLLTLMASTYAGRAGGAGAWEPQSYSVVSSDGYNRFPCKPGVPYKSFSDIFTPTQSFAVSRGKPMAIGEWGCVEQNACGYSTGDPLGKASWFTAAGTTMKSWPQVIFASYSHVEVQGYQFWVDTSDASLVAFRQVGLDPYFA